MMYQLFEIQLRQKTSKQLTVYYGWQNKILLISAVIIEKLMLEYYFARTNILNQCTADHPINKSQ